METQAACYPGANLPRQVAKGDAIVGNEVRKNGDFSGYQESEHIGQKPIEQPLHPVVDNGEAEHVDKSGEAANAEKAEEPTDPSSLHEMDTPDKPPLYEQPSPDTVAQPIMPPATLLCYHGTRF